MVVYRLLVVQFAIMAQLRVVMVRVVVAAGEAVVFPVRGQLVLTAAAAVVAGFAIMFYALRQNTTPLKDWTDAALQWILPFFGLAVALLMVSRIRYPHVTNRILRGQRSFGHVVAVVFFFVAIILLGGYGVPLAASVFVFYRPIHLAWKMWVQRKDREEPWF